MATVESLIADFTNAQKDAEAANEARYQQLLGIAQDLQGENQSYAIAAQQLAQQIQSENQSYATAARQLAKKVSSLASKVSEGFLADLERTKTRDVASGMQNLVSSGLSNTTRAAGVGAKWEEEVGVPARLKLEDLLVAQQIEAAKYQGSVLSDINQRNTSAQQYLGGVLNDIYQKNAAAKNFLAGIVEGRTDEYPDYSAMMQAVSAASSIGGGSIGGGSSSYSSTPMEQPSWWSGNKSASTMSIYGNVQGSTPNVYGGTSEPNAYSDLAGLLNTGWTYFPSPTTSEKQFYSNPTIAGPISYQVAQDNYVKTIQQVAQNLYTPWNIW